MKAQKFMSVFLLLSSMSLSLSSCGSKADYEFDFKGSAEFSTGKTYNVEIVGNKDEEQSFLLTVEENEAWELDGTWTYVENKGYKLYFDDSDDNYVYTKYDSSSKTFSFNYTLNLGAGFGTGKIKFSYKDVNFASKYDGIGLGVHPPIFTGGGWGSSYATSWRVTNLTCYEDGTCLSTCTYKGVTRSGKWTYDEIKNQYSFVFDVENFTGWRNVDVWTGIGNSYNQSFNNEVTYRHCYWVGDYKTPAALKEAGNAEIATDKPGRTELWLQSEGGRDYTTSTYQNGNTNVHDFVTTYDEETKTYTLIYEQIDSFFYVDRMVSYTLED